MSLDAYPRVSDWLRLGDGKILVRTGKVDIGQRISTALVGIVAEELTLDQDQIELQPVTTAGSPDEGMTSGSNSIEQSGHAIRSAAATLRDKVLAEAVGRLGGTAGDWRLDAGALIGPGTNTPVPIMDLVGELDLDFAVDASAVHVGREPSKAMPMRGLSDLVTGRYRFIHDLERPDMLHARIIRPPHAAARLVALSEGAVARVRSNGIEVIRDGSFLAVAGTSEWPVVRAAEQIARACDWDLQSGLEANDIFAVLTQGNAIRMVVKDGNPEKDAPIPPPIAHPSHSARYERPFTMHGALGPSAAFAVFDGKTLDIITHSQGIFILRETIAESVGMALDDVVLTHMPGAGCYGQSGADDAAFDAALIAMAQPGRSVLLKWTRDEEHAWEPYGPAGSIELSATLGDDGRLQAFSAEAIGGTFRGRPRNGPDGEGPAKLLANHFRDAAVAPRDGVPNMNWQGGLHRNQNPIYDIPETRFVKGLVPKMPLRTSALRCLGGALNVFAIESFMDEVARSAGQDAVEFRKVHLSDPRALAILDRLQSELSARPLGEGCGRGIAYAQYKNTMTRVGVAVDLTVSDMGEIQLDRAILVADAGRIVDRDGLEAQLEGGFLQAASWALYEEVTWDPEGITSRDWQSYPVLRFANAPRIEVILHDQPTEKSLGAGEASPGPTLAAIANAVFDATGLRLRRLPLKPEALVAAALAD